MMSPTSRSGNDTMRDQPESDPGKPDRAKPSPLPAPELDRRIQRLEDSIRAEENIIPGEDGVSENELTRAVDRSNEKRGEPSK